jgi:hypothetical protein
MHLARPPRCLSAWGHVQHQTEIAWIPVPGHHAARQRGAVFRTRHRPAARHLRPPRCSPAWSHVQNQTSPRPATSSATTLLVSGEPCSEPDLAPPRDLFGHHAACQRGAVFRTRPRPDHGADRREHRSTLASSVVAKQRSSWWIRSGLEHRPTLASSVVTQARRPRNVASDPAM